MKSGSILQSVRLVSFLPGETTPHRTAKSKRFFTEVIFTTLVAAPRYDAYEYKPFDGKIRIFIFVFSEKDKRGSKN